MARINLSKRDNYFHFPALIIFAGVVTFLLSLLIVIPLLVSELLENWYNSNHETSAVDSLKEFSEGDLNKDGQ